jgi:hypothetical protein
MKIFTYSILILFIFACNNQAPKEVQPPSNSIQKEFETDTVPLSYDEMKNQLEASDSSKLISVNDILRSLHPKNKKGDASYIKKTTGEELFNIYSNFYKLLNSSDLTYNNPAFHEVYSMLDSQLDVLNLKGEISTQEVLKITSIKSDINTWFANINSKKNLSN